MAALECLINGERESQTNRLGEYFMKLYILLTVCFLALRATAIPTVAQNNLPPEVREMARKVMMPVVYKVPGMDKVKVGLEIVKPDL